MDSTCDLERKYGDFYYLSSICDQKCLSSHAMKELYAKLLREIRLKCSELLKVVEILRWFFRLSSTRNRILYRNEHLSLLSFLFFRQQTDDKGKNDSIKIVSRGSISPASGKGSSRAAKMRAMARGEDTASSLKQEQQVRLYDCFLPC